MKKIISNFTFQETHKTISAKNATKVKLEGIFGSSIIIPENQGGKV